MLHLHKELNEWCEQFHSFYFVIPRKNTTKVMYFCMPWKIKVLFFLYRMQCFYEHRVLAKMPLDWRIKRLEKYCEKNSSKIKQLNTSFKITRWQRIGWKYDGWWYRTFHKKKYKQCIEKLSKKLCDSIETSITSTLAKESL